MVLLETAVNDAMTIRQCKAKAVHTRPGLSISTAGLHTGKIHDVAMSIG
jgi:hypothetical protein